ncbi:MAG: MFS transporter, partial [Oscillospiraceae bacterium]|nr:MFS transporter [Oscillospiraceae bacterium]
MEEKVKLSSRLWLGGADCMITTLNNIVTGGALTFFFVNHFGMSSSSSALCWLLFGLWNAVNDPLFGYISDKTTSKLGRRIPYIRYGSVLITLVFVLSWTVWFGTDSNTKMFVQMFLSLFLFDTLYTAIATSLYVMPFEMAVTNQARGKIMLVKLIFGLLALSVPLVLLAELENLLNSSLAGFQRLMLMIGCAAGTVIFFSTFFYKENGYTQAEEQYPFVQSLVTCLKNRSFLVFESISFSVTFIQTALMMGLSYYFDAFGINYLYCYGAMFAGILFGIWLWMKPGSIWRVKKSIILLCLIFGAALLAMLLLGRYTAAGIVGFFGAGIGFAGGMYTVPLMFGDVMDYDEHVCGLRREGMYAGVNSLICKPAISFANALFPVILGWFGFDASLTMRAQSPTAKLGIRVAWLLVPVVLLFLCAVLIRRFYPLSGEEWETTK